MHVHSTVSFCRLALLLYHFAQLRKTGTTVATEVSRPQFQNLSFHQHPERIDKQPPFQRAGICCTCASVACTSSTGAGMRRALLLWPVYTGRTKQDSVFPASSRATPLPSALLLLPLHLGATHRERTT